MKALPAGTTAVGSTESVSMSVARWVFSADPAGRGVPAPPAGTDDCTDWTAPDELADPETPKPVSLVWVSTG